MISIVVCTRNRPELIGDCLDALARNSYADAEILIIDQSTSHSTSTEVAQRSAHDPRIRYIPTSTVGLSRARNIGVRLSTGDVIAFTDDDCIPSPEWIESVARVFLENQDITAVYGRSLPWTKVAPGERPVAVKAETEPRVFKGLNNPWLLGHGCNMSFRREVFDVVGLFDEALGPGGILRNCDDADFTYRLLRSGLEAHYCPEVLVYHQQFRHGDDLWRLERDYGIGAGAFYSKHLRLGDLYILRLIMDRWCKAGAAHIIYGIITLRRVHLRLGWYRIVYSVVGMWLARRFAISTHERIYEENALGVGCEH